VQLILQVIGFLGNCPYMPRLPFPTRLKFAHQNLGSSQERLAKALGIDEGT
jgi:hypothetical protein